MANDTEALAGCGCFSIVIAAQVFVVGFFMWLAYLLVMHFVQPKVVTVPTPTRTPIAMVR